MYTNYDPENNVICDSEIDLRHAKSKRIKIDNFGKFRLLMWKNYLLQWRNKSQTLLQILIPVLFLMNLVFIRSLIKTTVTTSNLKYKSFSIETVPLRLVSFV